MYRIIVFISLFVVCIPHKIYAMTGNSETIEFSNQRATSIKPFWFMRHGQTADNKDHLISGQRDTPLDAKGRNQAFEAGKTLKNIGIKKIISSNLSRAEETAELIRKELDVPVQIVKELAERNWGAIDGKPTKDYKTRWDWNYEPQEGESFSVFRERVQNAFLEVITEDGVLIIAHGGTYRVLMDFIGVSHISFGNKPIPDNATPLYFIPPATDGDIWKVEVIKKE